MRRVAVSLVLLGALVAVVAVDVLALDALRRWAFADAHLPSCDSPAAGARCVTVLSGTLLSVEDGTGSTADAAMDSRPAELRCADTVRRVGLHDLSRPFWRARSEPRSLPSPDAPARCHVVDGTVVAVAFPTTRALLTTDEAPRSSLFTTIVTVDAVVLGFVIVGAVIVAGSVLVGSSPLPPRLTPGAAPRRPHAPFTDGRSAATVGWESPMGRGACRRSRSRSGG
jgi:hypothetical protein